MRKRAPRMYAAGLVMILLQICALMAIVAGTMWRTCLSNDMCPRKGTFCNNGRDRCLFCGIDSPWNREIIECPEPPTSCHESGCYRGCLAPYNTSAVAELCAKPRPVEKWIKIVDRSSTEYNSADKGGLSGPGLKVEVPCDEFSHAGCELDGVVPLETVVAWCGACLVNGFTGEADTLTNTDSIVENVVAMGLMDWVTLVLAGYVVSLTAIGEVRDVREYFLRDDAPNFHAVLV